MNRKAESPSSASASPAAAVSKPPTARSQKQVPSASSTAASKPTKDNNIPIHPKSHPKTLDIPSSASTPVKKATGTNGPSGTSSCGGGSGLMIPPKGDKRSVTSTTTTPAAAVPRLGRDNGSKQETPPQMTQHQQNSLGVNSGVSPSSSSTSSSPRSGINSSQFASICREVEQVREEHMAIRKSLSEREGELGKTRAALRNIAQERDLLRSKVMELEHILKHSPELQSQVSSLLTAPPNNGGYVTAAASNTHLHHASFQTMHRSANIVATTTSVSPLAPIPIYKKDGNSSSTSSSPSSSSLASPEQANSIMNVVSLSPSQQQMESPRRSILHNQKVAPSSFQQQQQQQRPDVTPSPFPGMLDSPRKMSIQNGNGNNNLKRGGNMNCQEFHLVQQQQQQHNNHNNKNLQQIHSSCVQSQQQTSNMYNMNKDKKQSISNPQDLSPEQKTTQQSNLNGRNDGGNNNNNHFKNIATSASAAAATRGGGGCDGGQNNQHHHHLSQSGISGLELTLLGPDSCSTKVVEHLVHPVQVESSIREIQHTLVVRGVPMNGDRLREVEIEIDRLNSRIDHLRSQNDVLTLNLEDAKSHADRLTVLLGKYESNNVALQLALRYSDQMTNAYEVLIALLETELGQVLAHVHAAGKLQPICPPKSSTPTNHHHHHSSTLAIISTSADAEALVISRSLSSGNNNNSNDNSPSDERVPPPPPVVQSPPPPTSPPREVAPASPDTGSNEIFNNGNKNHTNDLDNNRGDNMDNGNKTLSLMKNYQSNNDPKSPENITSPSSIMNLLEQAKRNRMTAEKAAHFLLSRFPQLSHNSSGMFLSPTESENNNGLHQHQQHHLVVSPSSHNNHHLERGNSSSVISSSESIASNLSNISGESCEQSCSISSDDGDDLRRRGENKMLSPKQRETSAIITVEENGDCGGNGDMMMTMTMMRSSTGQSSSSPTTTSSATFRAPTSLENPSYDCASVISTCLPQLGSQLKQGDTAAAAAAGGSHMESRIRSLIHSLKSERDAIKQTIVMKLERESLESLTPSPNPTVIQHNGGSYNTSSSGGMANSSSSSPPWTHAEARKLDLETAVLMQELMAMKEERAELRAQLFLMEKEKEALELRLGSYESQEEAYKAKIKFLKTEILESKGLYSTPGEIHNQNDRNRNDLVTTTPQIVHQQQQQQQQLQLQQNNENLRNKDVIINNNNNNNTTTNNVNWEREMLLKKRIHELAATLEHVTTSSQIRERQHQEMIGELNRANSILMQTLEASKKKYQNRIKRMEDQIVYISEKYATQLKFFGEMRNGGAAGRPMKTGMKSFG